MSGAHKKGSDNCILDSKEFNERCELPCYGTCQRTHCILTVVQCSYNEEEIQHREWCTCMHTYNIRNNYMFYRNNILINKLYNTY